MRSMTGYGRATASADGREITAELRAVNHRFLDLSFKMPRDLSFLEIGLREKIGQKLKRGHVDITMTYRNMRSDAKNVRVDGALCKGVLDALRAAGNEIGLADNLALSDVLALPDALVVEQGKEDEGALSSLAFEALNSALDALRGMREKEGENLLNGLSATLDCVEQKVAAIQEKAAAMPEKCYARVLERLNQLKAEGADPARMMQEAAFLADRCAVDEEITRLFSHIGQMRAAFMLETEQGRRMDFLVQEMNREVNTIASKSADEHISHLAVEIKCDIEKMREQIQNVE